MEDLKNNNNSVNQILEYDLEQNLNSSETVLDEAINNNSNIPETETIIELNLDSQDINEMGSKQNNTISPIDSNNSPEKIENQLASTTNCLALTIKEEHKLVAVKNVFFHSLKVTWKVIASTIALHILKIFF